MEDDNGENSCLTFIRRITPEERLTVEKFNNKEHNSLDEIYPLL